MPFAALDRTGNTLYCSSFSKTAPGYRIGWIATRRYIERALERKLAFTRGAAALPQAALAEFLSTGGYDNHLCRLRRTFEDTMAHMVQAIETAVGSDEAMDAAVFPPADSWTHRREVRSLSLRVSSPPVRSVSSKRARSSRADNCHNDHSPKNIS